MNRYSNSLSRERRFMLSRYQLADVAHRVVGVGSVGTRAYLALLFGNGEDDPLFLQVKESVLRRLMLPTFRLSRKSSTTRGSGW